MRGKRNILYVTLSIAISSFIHTTFFVFSSRISLPPGYFAEIRKTPSHFIRLGSVEINLPPPKVEQERKTELLLPHMQEKKEEPSQGKFSPAPPSGIEGKDGEGEPGLKAPSIKAPLPPGIARSTGPADIIQVDGDRLDKSRLDFNRILIPKIARTGEGSSLGGEGGGGSGGRGSGGGIPLRMRLDTPNSFETPEIPETRLLPPEKASVLDKYLDIKIYKHPIPEGGGFFRIDILPKKDAKLSPFKKDIVFCIDVSGSISSEKLAEFKTGVGGALKKLAPDDRFEIMAFRHREIPLFGTFRTPTSKSTREAEEFLESLARTGSTNIFSAIEPFAGETSKYKSPGRPLLVFLSSDGMVNSGEIVDSRQLINTFSNNNQDAASLFSFCTGTKANSFLLDLLSYRNRGESLKLPDIEKSGTALENFIGDVSDIYVMNLDYQISGNLSDLTFPKKMPHLYRNHPLSVYGFYTADVGDFGLRITGTDCYGKKQELIYKASIKDAENTDDNLPRQWGLQYIYHLYSRLTVSFDEKLKMQIRRTAAQYGIETPYFDQYLKDRKN